MDWFAEWIRQIILLVLIATFIDLLLPNQSFDRYVKLVMGLLIIMAILSPLLEFLNKDLELSDLLDLKAQPSLSTAEIDSLEVIDGRSKQLMKFQETQFEKEWAQNVEQIIKKQLSKEFRLHEVEISIKTALHNGHTPQIQSIEVQASVIRPTEEKTSSEIKPIEQMPPVQIELNDKKPVNKPSATTTQIKRYIEKTWQIPAKQIKIQIDAG